MTGKGNEWTWMGPWSNVMVHLYKCKGVAMDFLWVGLDLFPVTVPPSMELSMATKKGIPTNKRVHLK